MPVETLSISIHSLLAEGDGGFAIGERLAGISIHSLLAEGDPSGSLVQFIMIISIHSLLAEGDTIQIRQYDAADGTFQSTPSLRRETDLLAEGADEGIISIHSLLAEGDASAIGLRTAIIAFQSTPSLRRETKAP